jgi:hypothetical protein
VDFAVARRLSARTPGLDLAAAAKDLSCRLIEVTFLTIVLCRRISRPGILVSRVESRVFPASASDFDVARAWINTPIDVCFVDLFLPHHRIFVHRFSPPQLLGFVFVIGAFGSSAVPASIVVLQERICLRISLAHRPGWRISSSMEPALFVLGLGKAQSIDGLAC